MEFRVQTGELLHTESELAVLGSFEDVPLPQDVVSLMEAGDFKSKPNQTMLIYRGALLPKALVIGWSWEEKR